MCHDVSGTDELVDLAVDGDEAAMQQLMQRHRSRLRRMIGVRMDSRLSARLDPSDIVQETLTEAAARLPEYAKDRQVSFYPWLRKLAWQQLVKVHRYHVATQRRTVTREAKTQLELSDASVLELAERFGAVGSSPSQRMIREEMNQRVRAALQQMQPNDREVLVLKYLEQLAVREIAEILGVSEAAVKMRHARALDRLQTTLADPSTG